MRLSWRRFEAQEVLENLLHVADFLEHVQVAGQPVDGMLVAMPPDRVADQCRANVNLILDQ
jgi:hypothetical protein